MCTDIVILFPSLQKWGTTLAKEAGETIHGSLQRYGVVQDVLIDDVVLL